MIVKQIVDEDFVNYKKPSMLIAFPYCSWKCEKDCGMQVCQNSTLASAPNIDIDLKNVVQRYMDNPITSAIVCAGLEPFDSFGDLFNLICNLRGVTDDDIVIYTGYNKKELSKLCHGDLRFNIASVTPYSLTIEDCDMIEFIRNNFKNIIIKYGRYVPNQQPHYDEVLGVSLASDNQYAEKIS